MAKKISKENGETYFASGGGHCPHCGSLNTTTGGTDRFEGVFDTYCKCLDCCEEWTERFHLMALTNDVSSVVRDRRRARTQRHQRRFLMDTSEILHPFQPHSRTPSSMTLLMRIQKRWFYVTVLDTYTAPCSPLSRKPPAVRYSWTAYESVQGEQVIFGNGSIESFQNAQLMALALIEQYASLSEPEEALYACDGDCGESWLAPNDIVAVNGWKCCSVCFERATLNGHFVEAEETDRRLKGEFGCNKCGGDFPEEERAYGNFGDDSFCVTCEKQRADGRYVVPVPIQAMLLAWLDSQYGQSLSAVTSEHSRGALDLVLTILARQAGVHMTVVKGLCLTICMDAAARVATKGGTWDESLKLSYKIEQRLRETASTNVTLLSDGQLKRAEALEAKNEPSALR